MLRPGRIYFGTTVRLTAHWTDDEDNNLDPDTVVLQTWSPSGAEATYTYLTDDNVIRADEGQYTADVTASETGRWRYRWGAVEGAQSLYIEGQFLVQASPWGDDTRRAYEI